MKYIALASAILLVGCASPQTVKPAEVQVAEMCSCSPDQDCESGWCAREDSVPRGDVEDE